MIGTLTKITANEVNNKKSRESVALSGDVTDQLIKESHKNNLSKSEITEFALRILFKMSTNHCKNMLYEIYLK